LAYFAGSVQIFPLGRDSVNYLNFGGSGGIGKSQFAKVIIIKKKKNIIICNVL